MRPKVKICGITSYEDAVAALDLGAWALGFNFYSESPRFISLKDAAEIINHLPAKIEKVGVFVNVSAEEIKVRGKMAGITMVQLHGDEIPELADRLEFKKIIKAFRPSRPEDLEAIRSFQNIKYILIDAAVHDAYGGTGVHSDWNLAKMAKTYGPVILAGGLTPTTVLEACREVQPFAVDVASGVESKPGVKDIGKMKEFFEMVKRSAP